jgi:hypothetical protein
MFTVRGYFFFSKLAVSVLVESIVIVLVASVLPSDQFLNRYSPWGVAVTETVCPDSYSPPVVDTVPPSPADSVIVYLTIGAGGGVEVSSDEQDSSKTKEISRENSFFIKQIISLQAFE